MSRFGPCMCGATDCPSCGPAQGYEVVKTWTKNGWRYRNVDSDDNEVPDDDREPVVYDTEHDDYDGGP